ncbi:pneumococcal-type histidine triad protein [Streptococcus oricebi]
MSARQVLENQDADDSLFEALDALLDRLADPKSKRSQLWSDAQNLINQIQHPERKGLPNSQIAYSPEELAAAKAAGKYTTSDGYIFDVKDIEKDEGDAYVASHLGHSHWIPKADLSQEERAAAEAYCKEQDLTAKKPAEQAGREGERSAQTGKSQALYESLPGAKRIPLEQLPYNLAYVVDYRDGQFIIPHQDHYHNLALAWFDQGLYQAPVGYSLEDLFATVKYYIEHPAERPSSNDGWGRDSQHGQGRMEEPKEDSQANQAPAEEGEKEADKVEEDNYDKEQEALAQAYGLTLKDFQTRLTTLALRYGVSLESISYQAESKTISLQNSQQEIKTINLLSMEEVS